jgi:hypothetical protein
LAANSLKKDIINFPENLIEFWHFNKKNLWESSHCSALKTQIRRKKTMIQFEGQGITDPEPD